MLEFTLAEAAGLLEPPMSERQLRQIIVALGWQPDGTRKNGHRGRPYATYDWTALSDLHKALVPFLRQMPYAKPQPTGLSKC